MEEVIRNVVELSKRFISLDHARLVFYGALIPAGLTKLVPQLHKPFYGMWRNLSNGWFWYAIGLFELAIVAALYKDRHDIAIPMNFALMGGVFSACTVIHPETFFCLPFAILMSLCTCIIADSVGYPLFPNYPLSVVTGFAIGIVINTLSGGSKKRGSKKN